MSYNIRKFLLLFVLGISLGVYALSLIFLYYNNKAYKQEFKEAVNKSIEASSEKISRNVVSMCRLAYSKSFKSADEHLSYLFSTLSAYGDISVRNEEGGEYTYSENGFESNPVLKFGDLEIKNSDEIDALLNEIKGNLDCDFAIYMRVNADADLLNIIYTTSTLGDIYTPESVIFRVGEDGKDSRIVNTLLLNEPVDELIALQNTYIYIRYIPIVATTSALNSKFIGALVCYEEEKNLNRIYDYIKTKKIKTDGFYWIMEDLRNGEYRYKLSQDSVRDGNLLSSDELSKKERDYITNLTLNARFLRSGEISTDFIEMESREDVALVSYLYFEPWNWIIGTTVYKSQIENFSTKVPSFSELSIYYFIGLFVLILSFALVSSYFFAIPIGNFFNYIKRNFAKGKVDTGEKFKTFIVDFKLFVRALKDTTQRVDSFSEHLSKSKSYIGNLSQNLLKNAANIGLLTVEQCDDAKESKDLINSMYGLSQKLTEFSEKFKVEANNTLIFTRQKSHSLKALKAEGELLKDIGGGFSSRFLRIRNIIENLSEQLEALNNYANKTKSLSGNMKMEIGGKDVESSIFSLLVEDTDSFYRETSLSIVTMKKFLEQMRQGIDSTISEMRDFLSLMDNGISEIDDILEKLATVIEQIATQQSRFQEISRGAGMQAEAILQVLKIINDLKRYTESTKDKISEFDSILRDLDKFYHKLN